MHSETYMKYLENKEKKILFSFRHINISHNDISVFFRVLKGLLLGFGLGNIIPMRSGGTDTTLSLMAFITFSLISLLLINYERRYHNRKGLENSIIILFRIFSCSVIISLLSLLYSGNFIVILTTTVFFASLAYSME